MARPISSPVREPPPCNGCRRPEKRAGCHDICREYGDWKAYVAYEKDYPQCGSCDFYHSMGEYPAECGCDGAKPVTRPPQSWCYVEEDNA